jgi:starch synthase
MQKKELKILLTGYEVAPFYKKGGLGDVLGSLPKALSEIDVDARVVIPYYSDIRIHLKAKKLGTFSVYFGTHIENIGIYQTFFPKTQIPVYLLENKHHLSEVYNRGVNKSIDQFAFFDLIVSHFVLWLSQDFAWTPNVVHCNDWHTALIPLILKTQLHITIPTLLTIHNLGYQGKGSMQVFDLLHIEDKDIKYVRRGTPANEINILGEGIIHATKVSTVSPTYAQEIITNYHRDPIQGFLNLREKEFGIKGEITGILNGIDYDIWNPEEDLLIKARYSSDTWKTGKKENKKFLLNKLFLQDKITCCFIGRMAEQKGIDMLLAIIDKFIILDINIIFLGSGNEWIEKEVKKKTDIHASNIRAQIVYDESFAHLLYSGSDFILIPSHYEPCGLIQMIAMRYGTIPIAARTGGLADSIQNELNGFLFEKDNINDMLQNIKKATSYYFSGVTFETMVKKAMKTNFSWSKSAKAYKLLYKDMVR